jgi:NADH dehydrogenase [ubiquinone] 1 alpha subcomplex assembly factor 6
MDDYDYCAAQVREYDSDRYVTALFAPASRRPDLLALHAFNLEVARSREAAREPMLGRIRLQWWRDAITECYEGTPRRHQVVQPLAEAIRSRDLPRELFDRIIDAREADHDDAPMESIERLAAYAEATGGAPNLLALRILGVHESDLERAAAAIGAAWALTGMMRGMRHLLVTGRPVLPSDVMKRHALSQEALLHMTPSESLKNAVREIAEMAHRYLNETPSAKTGAAVAALLPSVLARAYLKRLARTGYDPFDRRNMAPLRLRAWRLIIPALTGRF